MTTILPRRGTAAQWTAANPVLAMGELGFETDTKKWKRGDGATAWTALAYYQPSWNDVTAKPEVIAAGADQAAARAAIGAGTSNLAIGSTSTTAKAGNYQPGWTDIASKPSFLAAGVVGDGTTDDRAAFASSDASAAASNLPLMILPGTYRVASNLTINSPVWMAGGIIKPDNGVTVTLAGGVASAPPNKCFDHSVGGKVAFGRLSTALSPLWWGAVGDGVTDCTSAIEAAWVACGTNHSLYFPPGNFVYNGTGLGAEGVGVQIITGAGHTSTTITLGTNSYLLTPSVLIGNLLLEGVRIVGGKGAIKHTFTDVDTVGVKIIRRCWFTDYTECAIATESVDGPYWLIEGNWFRGANATTTIGVALAPGLTDGCMISRNVFIRNRVHVKVGQGGNNAHIEANTFFQVDTVNSGGARIDVWIVPSASSNNAGNGFTIDRNKFSGENRVAGDYPILYADAGAGATNGTKMPSLAADSTGYILGHTYTGNMFRFNITPAPPLIYSTTPRVWNLAVRDTQLWATYPSYVIQFRTVPVLDSLSYATTGNSFGPFYGTDNTQIGPLVSNDPGIGFTDDTLELLQTRSTVVRRHTSGSSSSYQDRLASAISTFSTFQCTLTPATDVYGGTNATTLELTNTVGIVYRNVSAFVVGLPCWVEIDVAAPAGTVATNIRLSIADQPSGDAHWMRLMEPAATTGWVTYAFHFSPRTVGTSPRFEIRVNGAVGNQVRLGRPRVYQGHERQLGGQRPTISAAATDAATTQSLVNDLRSQLISLGVLQS